MAAADDALKALFGAIKGADTKLIGDVARPVTAGRLDALTRLLPVAVPEEVVAPVRLSFGEALTRPGYVPRAGDWDVADLRDRLGKWSTDLRYEEAGRLLDEWKNLKSEQYKVALADQMLSDYMPEYGQSIKDITEIGPRIDEAYKLYGSAIPEGAPSTRDEFLDILDEAAQDESERLNDNVWLSDFYEAADQNPNAAESYAAFDEFVNRLDELPEDNPLRLAFSQGMSNFVPSRDLDYDSYSDDVYNTLYNMIRLQKVGVNRDALTEVLSNPRLTKVFTEFGDKPYDALYALADMEPAIAEKVAKAFFYLPENVIGSRFIQTVRDIENPAVQETFLTLLPEWTDSLDELVDTAKLLAE